MGGDVGLGGLALPPARMASLAAFGLLGAGVSLLREGGGRVARERAGVAVYKRRLALGASVAR